ncbi:testis-expressed protein 9 [Xenentodon cancila]
MMKPMNDNKLSVDSAWSGPPPYPPAPPPPSPAAASDRPPTMKKRPSSPGRSGRSKQVQVRSVSALRRSTDDLLAKEEHYKLMNAELEAKTADLVRQAEKLVAMSKKKMTSAAQSLYTREQVKKSHCKRATSTDSAEAKLEDAADLFLAKAVQNIEEKMNEAGACENVVDDVFSAEDNIGNGVLDAQTRVLKAKVRILQEELDQLSSKYYKKDDENAQLTAKIKELEEDRAKLQKTTSIQQTQIEKHKALAEESSKKSDGLQLQVSALNKEIDNVNRTNKNATAVHSTVEVRLNRALEEVAKLKTELKNTKQMTKDKISEEHESRENLLAENKMLKKQKAELIIGFKKQLKLISILKKSMMHSEAGKQLSLTEEEFIKALDLGKS